MTEPTSANRGDSPVIEVRVYDQGSLVHRQLCETVEEAEGFIEDWPGHEHVDFEVDDLSVRHRQAQVLSPEADESLTPADEEHEVETAEERYPD